MAGPGVDPRAAALLRRYHERFGGSLVPPVPVEAIAEDLLGLSVGESESLQVSGMLLPAEREVWLNAAEPAPRNYVVQDSKWEQSAAYHLDTHPRVVAFVKNQGLGFAIPYLHDDRQHSYIPDFIVRLDNEVHLILEPKGHDEKEAVKTQAAHRWVNAVNADGTYGEWRYEIVHDMNTIPALIDECALEAVQEVKSSDAV